MCFDTGSRPPIAAIAGAAVSHETITLASADGTPFAAFPVVPDAPKRRGPPGRFCSGGRHASTGVPTSRAHAQRRGGR